MIVNRLYGFGDAAAVNDEVCTNRFTVETLAAESSILLTLPVTSGITTLGSAENVILDATCAMPATPVIS